MKRNKFIPNWLLIEKPQFNNFPKIRFTASRYCYLLPTGCGTSKSVSELKYNSGYSTPQSTAYTAQAYMITHAYTIFFLWFRCHIAFRERKMSSSIMQKVNPLSKSEKSIDDLLKSE